MGQLLLPAEAARQGFAARHEIVCLWLPGFFSCFTASGLMQRYFTHFSPFFSFFMDDVFVGEIRAVGFGFVPNGWAACDGSLLPINRNTALFSLLGNTYGGDGRTTFALPDLRSRAAVSAGQGPGLANYALGMKAGVETVTLSQPQMPAHIHSLGASATVNVSSVAGTEGAPKGNFLGAVPTNQYAEEAGAATMAAGMISGTSASTGGNLPHENRQPYLGMYYIIALVGEYPQRS
jgi:microcystin-dependent protein